MATPRSVLVRRGRKDASRVPEAAQEARQAGPRPGPRRRWMLPTRYVSRGPRRSRMNRCLDGGQAYLLANGRHSGELELDER